MPVPVIVRVVCLAVAVVLFVLAVFEIAPARTTNAGLAFFAAAFIPGL